MIRITDGKMVWGQSAAGVLFVCKKTKRILLLLRSEYVLEPDTWGIVSGKIDEGENPKDAATREAKEEIGYEAQNLIQVYVYEHGDFRFYNFVCYVEDEFQPELNWENEKYEWFSINDIPNDLHYGVKDLFSKIMPEDIIKGNMSKITKEKNGGKITKDIEKFDEPVDELNKLDIYDSFFDVDLTPFKDGGVLDYHLRGKIKKVYVSIRVGYRTTQTTDYSKPYFTLHQIESFDNKTFEELSVNFLEGIAGVSTSKYNIAEWLVHRDCLIVMPFEDFIQLNFAEQILYEDADYLTRNGLDVMFRIYDRKGKDDSDYMQVLGNLFPKIKSEFDLEYDAIATGSNADLFAVCSSIFDIYNSGKFKEYFSKQNRVNSVKDFVDIVLKYNESGQYKNDYYYNKDFPQNIDEDKLEKIIRRGIVNSIKIYSSESEWILKDKTLYIPDNSQLFFVEKNYDNYFQKIQEYIEKYNLKKYYKIGFVKQEDIEKFRRYYITETEKRYAEILFKGRTDVSKKIEKALFELNNEIRQQITEKFNYEFSNSYSYPLKDEDGVTYNSILQIKKVDNILQDFTNLFLQTFTNYAKSIIDYKSKHQYILFFENFVNKVRNIRDEYSTEDEQIAFDTYGSRIYASTIYAIYTLVLNDIDIYKYANKIKEFVGSDLYRYYTKAEISFKEGGEMQSNKLAIVSGLKPANIIHAKELGGIERGKLRVINKGLESKYFNKGDIILVKSDEYGQTSGNMIPLNEFILAVVPENTNQHILNILSKYDIVAMKYNENENLMNKVQRMEYLYFSNGGNVPEANGDCYVVAAKILIENNYTKKISFIGTPYLVHAEVTGQGEIEGLRYGHAWVEDDFFVYDYSNGREIVFPKELYYRIGEVVNQKGKYKKYTKEQARKKMFSSGHYGCWDLETKYKYGGVLLTGGLSENMTEQDLANKYKISIEEFSERLKEGMNVEKEHTNNPEAQKKIAKDHLFEDIDYYKKLKQIEGGGKNFENMVALPDCYSDLNRLQEVLATQGYKISKLETSEYSDGGIVVGKRHSESDENGTGERFIVESTGQLVELEGGEIVINNESMTSDKLYDFEGKKMTSREIASELNHRYGGVKFNDGGKVSCGCNKFYYGGELPSATLDSLSGGEGVINFKTSQSKNKYEFDGKKMTPREILSKINTDNGGKKF